jgi:hypothetical protein
MRDPSPSATDNSRKTLPQSQGEILSPLTLDVITQEFELDRRQKDFHVLAARRALAARSSRRDLITTVRGLSGFVRRSTAS